MHMGEQDSIHLARQMGLHYIAAVENLESILEHGILSRTEMIARGGFFADISDPEVQARRERWEPILGRPIHDYVPLYLNPKNPMLYVRKALQDRLVILEVDPDAVLTHSTIYTDGNAAASGTGFSLDPDILLRARDALEAAYWTDVYDGKRRRMAEALIHGRIAPEAISQAACRTALLADQVASQHGLYASADPTKFF